MSKINRFNGNLQPFALNASTGARYVFGNDAVTGNDLDSNITADFIKGWENGTVTDAGGNDYPPMSFFNALGYTSTALSAYLHQVGVPDYNALQEYYEGSLTNVDGVLYSSKSGVDGTPNVGNNPETDRDNWKSVNVPDVDTIADLRDMASTPDRIWVSGYHAKDDGAFGSNIFRWNSTSTEADNGGTIIKLDSVATGRYELQYDGAVNVKWFGAKGDGVTDDSTAIQAALDTLTSMGSNFVSSIAAYGAVNTLYFPDGKYIVNSPLTLATTDERYRVGIIFDTNALLRGESFIDSNAYTLTIKGLFGAFIQNLQVHGVGCNALKIVESRNSRFENIGAGSNNDYSLYLGGVIFNNTFTNTRINQNVSINGATYGLYWDIETVDTSVTIDGAGAPINHFNGLYIAGADNLIYLQGNKDKSTDSWSSGAIKFSTLELEGFNVSALNAIDIDRQILFENAWYEGIGTATYENYFLNCTQISLRDMFFGTSNSELYFEGCNRIVIDNCYAGGSPTFRGKNGNLLISNCTFNENHTRILHLPNQTNFSDPLNTATFDDVKLENVQIKSYYSANIDTASYNHTNKEITITTSGSTNIDSYTDYVYIDKLVVSYTDINLVARETNLVGVFKILSFTSSSSFSIYADIDDYSSAFTLIDGQISEYLDSFTTDKKQDYDYTLLANPRSIGAGERCTVSDDSSYTNISPLGIKESLITVTDNSNFPLVHHTISASGLPADTENEYVLSVCFRELLPTPSVSVPMEYIRSGGCSEANPYGLFGQTVLKDGIRYVIFSSRVTIDNTDTLLRTSLNYARKFDVGSKIVFGGAVLTRGRNIPVF